jgi:hypothetical protein
MKQHERDIAASTGLQHGGSVSTGQHHAVALTSDVTSLHYRVRKLQQKVVDKQQRARHLELRAAQKTQKTAELKVKVDRYTELSRLEEQEGNAYRQRADRLQMVTETDVATNLSATASPPTNSPDRPPSPP